MAIFGFRRVDEEFEARLSPPPGRGADGRGKIERKRFGDGVEELEVKVRKLDVPDGATLEMVVEGRVLLEMEARGGRSRVEFDTESDGEVPRVAAGESVRIHHDGQVLLEGTFQED